MSKFYPSLLLAAFLWAASCKSGGNEPADAITESVPLTRTTVNPNPVAEYREKVEDPLNDWYFTVRLYETPKTFNYLIKMQYEEVSGEDTLTLPDFGTMPEPELRKGKDKYSCVIGFLDNGNHFREYKQVWVDHDKGMRLTTLRHFRTVTRPAP